MKIMALTDIHGRVNYPETIISQLRGADLVLIAGDITNFGDREDADAVIRSLTAVNCRILGIPGNCDRSGVTTALQAASIDLHAKCRIIDNTLFFGIGGCNKTPFHTPLEYSEDEIAAILQSFCTSSETKHTIIISHSPPHRTKLDRMFLGVHVGSKSLRTFIEEKQPDLVLCGHIHEARGFDRIGRTLIINPGVFPRHYALINSNDNLDFELR
ncbi:MAG: metallophosphoesterase family protein [candidate division WOR-3 bacterium]|nr:MAG: metallophosphoesterase family protein [candidate division WOR-3 bacterium]